jgi:diacylglycerol diphosphate phosphatase / phosphatidate phosphatase
MFLAPVPGDLRAVVYGFAGAMASTNMVTNCAKNYVGRLRPFYYQKCGFDMDTFSCNIPSPMSDYIRQSFPSGHSSLSMCSMLYLTLYCLGKINLAKSYHGRFVLDLGKFGQLRYAPLIALASTSLMGLSTWISISRIHDNWHHPSDVLFGTVLGAAIAVLFYHMGYTSIMDVDSNIPLVSRARKSALIYNYSPQNQDTSFQQPQESTRLV